MKPLQNFCGMVTPRLHVGSDWELSLIACPACLWILLVRFCGGPMSDFDMVLCGNSQAYVFIGYLSDSLASRSAPSAPDSASSRSCSSIFACDNIVLAASCRSWNVCNTEKHFLPVKSLLWNQIKWNKILFMFSYLVKGILETYLSALQGHAEK